MTNDGAGTRKYGQLLKYSLPVVLAIAACVASFGCGFWVSDRRLESKAFEEGQRQLGEFAVNAARLGILDYDRLTELVESGTNDAGVAVVAGAAVGGDQP